MPSKSAKLPINWSQNRGRNDWDIASEISPDMSAEALNVDLEKGTLGRKRRGSATQSFSGSSFTGYNVVIKFVPGQDDAAAETFIVDTSGTTKILRVAAGTSASNLTLTDNVATNPHLVRGAVLNGKLFLAYDSTVNRLHVFSPTESTSTVRRAGLATPGAPTISNQGSGTYATAARFYRVAGQVFSGSNLLRQSLLGTASATFTPDGSHQYARVTAPSFTEGETHWQVFGSIDGVDYFELAAPIAVATTTYDDDDDPADYDTFDPAPDEGTYTPFPSVKMLLSTGDRLLGFGVWETTAGDSLLPKAGRVYFTPVLDSTDSQDDERINNTVDFQGWIDISRNGGAEDRALAGPLDAMIFAFQSRGIWSLVPSGVTEVPYRRIPLRDDIGAVSQESTFMGEDEAGRACIYFLDPIRGPYRYGPKGFEWLGYDIQTLWATVNLAATTRVASGVWDSERRACVFGIATGSSNTLSEFAVFYAREGAPSDKGDVRGGWVRHAGASAWTFNCMAFLPETYGSTMSRTLKVYAGNATVLNRYNDESTQQDATVSFQAYVKSASFDQGALQLRKRLQRAYLQATAGSGVTITLTLIRNFGDETNRTDTVSLTAVGSESRVFRRFEAIAAMDAASLQFQLGDSAAANNAWTLDEFVAQLEVMDEA